MATAILARHGESEVSIREAVNGDPSIAVGLTSAGEEQARGLGEQLAGESIDLCVVSEFPRARRTAELAIGGRPVPVEIWPELNEPVYGAFEGGSLDDYLEWAWAHGSGEVPPGGGESRHALVSRYGRAFRRLLERPERLVLVVAHSLPIAYALAAARGEAPGTRAQLVDYARPFQFGPAELRAAVDCLEVWCAAPTW